MIKIEVHSTRAVIRSQEPLTVGLRGAKARFSFGEAWDALIRTVVFRQGEKTVTVPDIGAEVTIPWEVLTVPGEPVQIGVYGTDSTGTVAIPTVWAETQPVRQGTDPEGDPATEPTPGLWEQLQGKMGSLEQLQTKEKSSLVAAIDEANRAVFTVKVTGTEGSYSADCSMQELLDAWNAGKVLLCFWEEHQQWLAVCQVELSENRASQFRFYATIAGVAFWVQMKGSTSGGNVYIATGKTMLASEDSKLPNPKKLTVIGAAKAEYDGSEEVIIGIPSKVSQLQNDSGFLTEVPVSSVNGRTGAVAVPVAVKVTVKQEADGSYSSDLYSAAIMEAHNAGNMVYCQNGSRVLTLLVATDHRCIFGCVHAGSMHTVTVLDEIVGVVSAPLASGDGADGITPHIGGNGNWFIGETDTGMPSRGEEGHTPVKGTDYYTDEEKAEFEAMIAQELAKRDQLKPEFANSTEECTDTSRLYVLPDGYLYAYVLTEAACTNKLPLATDADGNVYGAADGKPGYQSGARLSSDGSVTSANGMDATGFIPCSLGDVVRLQGIHYNQHSASYGNHRIAFYDSSRTHIANAIYQGAAPVDNLNAQYNPDGDLVQFVVQPGSRPIDLSTVAYFRICGDTFDRDAVITVNEEIGVVSKLQWTNTGHKFVAADYEERVGLLEDRVDELEAEGNAADAYIAQEAKRVSQIVQSKRTVGSLTFTAMSDPHVYVGTTADWLKPNETSVRDAGYGLSELRKHLSLDFVAMLGDYTYGAPEYTVAQVKKDLQYFRQCMSDGCKGIPNIWATGNHDINYGARGDRRMTEDEMFAHVISNNVGTVQDHTNIGRNYGYIDFDNQQIRCIYLNSVDSLDYPDLQGEYDDALEITAIQTQWLVDTGLDLSAKQNPADWQIVVFSHQPLNLYSHVLTVLEAYRDGTSGSVAVTTNEVTTPVSYDFSAVARGEIIANIHGHNHNFAAKKIGTSEEWLWRICTPNMDVTRNNESATAADISWRNNFGEFDENGNPVYYNKTQGTATSTSFCVFVVDRKNRKIHAVAYGAGVDREIDY